ncbi:MAG: hypothetical protein JJT82_08505 [Legionellaceae bacterium]|nr:hypothetical protein [Legionellaceae bacterium]
MPFFDDHRAESRSTTLISRMVALSQAVKEGTISEKEMETISKQSTPSLESKWEGLVKGDIDITISPNDALKKLYDVIKKAPTLSIQDASPLIAGLKRFDMEHGDYLPLTPLATKNDQTLAVSLNDLATFYNVFIKHMSYKIEHGELGDLYALNFDALEARTDWLRWQSTRPTHVRFDPAKIEHPGLFEKFLAGQIKRDEWLSDLDIRRELTLLGLEKLVHIVPFKADDIGLALHFERQKHELDDPKEPYAIPLIVNLGEDGHSRIDSRGVHWTRILVTVDPRNIPPSIDMNYNDELFLPESSKKEINQVLKEAIKYRTELGGYSEDENFKIYQAYPECDHPTITITGSGEQRDGFTCGYRTLKGTLQDLIQNQVVEPEEKEDYQKFLNCNDTKSLRNFVYRSLLGHQRISNETKDVLQQYVPERMFKESLEKEQFIVNPTLVEGQLLAFSKPTAKKEGKKGKFTGEQLQALETLVEQNKKIVALGEVEIIKQITSSKDDPLELNLQNILDAVTVHEKDPDLILQVVFDHIAKNNDLNKLRLAGTGQLDQQLLHEKIDSLPLRITLTSDEPNLKSYLEIVNARNTLLDNRMIKVAEGADLWDSLFDHLLFTPPDYSTGSRFEWMNHYFETNSKAVAALGVAGFSKLLHYMAAHEERFVDTDFPFKEFDMTHINTMHDVSVKDSGLSFLSTLREHLQSEAPFIPFKQFNFDIQNLATVDQETLMTELAGILAAMQAPGLEKLIINTQSLAAFPEKTIDRLIALIKEQHYPTVLSFTAPKESISPTLQEKLQELENVALSNRRQGLASTTSPSPSSPKTNEPVFLGKIGKAILNTEGLEGLNTEVQIQEQQQQQVQQQIQTALDDEELPEEDEISEEAFTPYVGTDELLTRETINKLEFFVSLRHPHLLPEQCWDLITGVHADVFKYGIKKMTVSAAKILIENLQDVQYGLHPDNLPRGFSLQQDKDGGVVLSYTAFNPAINPNESPLTISFSKPMAPNQWSGNSLQFMTRKQAESLYESVIEPMRKPRPSLEDCIREFFFLKNDKFTVGSKEIALTDSEHTKILHGMIAAMTSNVEASAIQKQMENIFGSKLTSSNIKALSEVLYEQGPNGLSTLLEDLSHIKTIKGETFFASFKTCFIDPSKNLNELTTDSARVAMQKLLTLSSAQTAWWLSLTEQHTSNLLYQPESDQSDFTVLQLPGKRWANLTELTEGFLHFCGQLDDVSPGLALPEYCPLTDVADMQVALDRLLTTILPNALDVDEQFYQGLSRLSLAPLGPFYASRYEGYKLVTHDMLLDLDKSYSDRSDSLKRAKENKRFSPKDFCFRCDKANMGGNFADTNVNTDDKKKSIFLRYIATFNHRAPLSAYLDAYQKLSLVKSPDADPTRQVNLLMMIAVFGTGKRGKHFKEEDIKRLLEWNNTFDPDQHPTEYRNITKILTIWRGLRMQPIRPSITEIIDISDLALKTQDPVDFIRLLQSNLIAYTKLEGEEGIKSAENYIESLLTLSKNKNALDAGNFQNIVSQIEGLNSYFRDIKEVTPEVDLPSKIRSATAKLLAVCHAKDIDESNTLPFAKALYAEVEKCVKTHGLQTTSDLLELLGNIDVEKSTDLPSLKELTALVKEIAENPKPEYNALEQKVKSKLPSTCVIQMEKVTASPVEPPGNLHTIITKYMGEIRAELEPYKSQLGEEFYDTLATPEGTKSLLDSLDNIGDMSGFLGSIIQGKIKDVMLKVYDSVTRDGIARIGIKDEIANNRLSKVLNHKINHRIKKEDDFKEFCKLFAGELQSFNQFLGNLQTIHKTWPADFRSIQDALDTSTKLNAFPLPLLAHTTGALVNNFDKNAPFPTDLLRKFLAPQDVNENTQVALKGIVDEILDIEKTSHFTNTEKTLLCELGLRYCDTAEDPRTAPKYISKILGLKTTDGDLFIARLKLLSASDKVDNKAQKELDDAFNVLKELDNPELGANAVGFFTETKNREKDFLPAMTEIGKIGDTLKRSLILAITLKAAQQNPKEYKGDLLREVIINLHKLDPKILKQLDALYRSPKHPELSSLNELISNDTKPLDETALETLQAEYDRDYWLKTQGMDRNFDSSQLAKYLNNLQDMNYERPLLLSQREELQRWFLYIHAIGNNRGIPTQPWTTEGGACKPVKEMSHEEIQGLLKQYRSQLNDTNLPEEERLKVRLETIALLREAMYRGTGKFPRPTQILYLLTAMQSGQDFIAQIQTGQGKSMTAGLAAAMANIEGKTVDICTSSLFLANEGLEENYSFFNYLGMKAKLIHANSGKEEYETGAIHYSSMSELALHRSKMRLLGTVFPDDCTLIADEVDFSTLDDSTRYRYATALDPVTDPYKSPYTWIYESLVQFVDTQNASKSDEDFIAQAKSWLINSAKTREAKTQLRDLEEQPEVYRKRLETWLVAAGKTNQLVEMEQVRFRVVPLEHKKYGSVSKACILTGGRPNIQAEFSDSIQQFLHVRLRQRYRKEIDGGKLPDFLVEPEKTYITTLNSKILLNTYKQRFGMSGTAGSRVEIQEQYGKYGFRFVDIPPFTESQRQDLKPILTNPKYVTNPEAESRDHLNRIVRETLYYLSSQKTGLAGPILIHCADKAQGEQIYNALQDAMNKNSPKYQSKFQGLPQGIQRFYSSEKTSPEARNKEEIDVKDKAGENGMITISTVFGRGTDIKPKHDNGLYTIDTFVDTDPYSSEDLERAKRQKIGRAGRAGQVGFTRLIVRRSEFSDIYTPKQVHKIPETLEGLDHAISELNRVRNEKRVVERQLRESFDDVKDIIYQEFFKFIQVINSNHSDAPKRAIRDTLTKQWNLVLSRIDDRWETLQHDPEFKGNMVRQLEEIAEFACQQWNEQAKDNGALRTVVKTWAEYNKLSGLELPPITPLDSLDLVETIRDKKPHLERYYVKRSQQYGQVDPSVSEAAVYSDFISTSKFTTMRGVENDARAEATNAFILSKIQWLSTEAHQKKLRDKFNITRDDASEKNVKEIMGAVLYLRYKAYRDGNPVAHARLSHECHKFEQKMIWSKNHTLISAVVDAQKEHFNALTHHRGEHESQKVKYLSTLMTEGRRLLPEQTSQWKKDSFTTWWNGSNQQPGIKTQAEDWLNAYKDKWWTRGYVSSDRKTVVTDLLGKLKNDQSPQAILRVIAEARGDLLNKDIEKSRSLKSSVHGRLYRYLNELELKVQAAMSPAELDAHTEETLNKVKDFLQKAASLGIKTKEMREITGILDNKITTPQEKYKALSVFFSNILSMGKPEEVKNDNWEAFQTYCEQTKLQMVHYFAQCEKNHSFNEQRSVQVYQAASEAASAHFQHVMDWDVPPKLNLATNEKFHYRDKSILFEIKDYSLINRGIHSPLFLKVNQADTYRELLSSLEKSIVENSPDDTRLLFKTVTLDKSDRYEDEGFKLSVKMMIDGVPAQIDYDINMNTGAMYCNDQQLQELDKPRSQEPKLGKFTLDKKLEELQHAVSELVQYGDSLTKETKLHMRVNTLTEQFKQKLDSLKKDESETQALQNSKNKM